jgi:2-C-methyl-D-erythritol 4-phosphate cytidylyltransferase
VETSPQPAPAAAYLTGAAGAILLAAQSAPGGFDPYWVVVGGKSALTWSVAACARAAPLGVVALVVASDRLDDACALVEAEGWRYVRPVAAHGAQQCGAIAAGLAALPVDCHWVVLHDAARPLLTPELILAGLTAAARTGVACACEPVKETIKRARVGVVTETLERAHLALLQTPQVFARERLLALVASDAGGQWADAAARAAALGMPVATFPGGHENLRVATADDVALAADVLARRQREALGGAHG